MNFSKKFQFKKWKKIKEKGNRAKNKMKTRMEKEKKWSKTTNEETKEITPKSNYGTWTGGKKN